MTGESNRNEMERMPTGAYRERSNVHLTAYQQKRRMQMAMANGQTETEKFDAVHREVV